jgi:hypothetical protein
LKRSFRVTKVENLTIEVITDYPKDHQSKAKKDELFAKIKIQISVLFEVKNGGYLFSSHILARFRFRGRVNLQNNSWTNQLACC